MIAIAQGRAQEAAQKRFQLRAQCFIVSKGFLDELGSLGGSAFEGLREQVFGSLPALGCHSIRISL
jgi:hypothetical protein